ncbi:hypothetical protein DPMN_117571 [Dreissena polymorpha]|uniref:Uncharacterized protein n=1 Tax=Dreissena polymorpha TaxID=45954 RepID=A0A9D4JMQ3_DREPO|nr:hypothetical protein DPMN_117571 [Dreissena polymorpha]
MSSGYQLPINHVQSFHSCRQSNGYNLPLSHRQAFLSCRLASWYHRPLSPGSRSSPVDNLVGTTYH